MKQDNIVSYSRIYPSNQKGNRIVTHTAFFDCPNLAKDFYFFLKKRDTKLKSSFFLGLRIGNVTTFNSLMNKEEKACFEAEATQELVSFMSIEADHL